jgi:hypothetical protein
MPSPKDIEDKIERMLNAWRTLAPTKKFGGMTLDDFETACAPSRTARARLADIQDQEKQAIADREHADENTLTTIQYFVNGVLADPTEGPDSALYGAFGYTPKSARKTGLTRKRKEPEEK